MATGRSSVALTTPNTAVVAPMPSVRVASATAVNPRLLVSTRRLYRISWTKASMSVREPNHTADSWRRSLQTRQRHGKSTAVPRKPGIERLWERACPGKECGLRPRRPDRPEQATPESRWADRARRSRTGTARGWRTKVVICRRPGHRQSIRWPLQGQHEYPVGTGVTSRIATDPDPVPWLQRLPAQPLLTQLGRIVELDGPSSCAALFAHNHEMDQRVRIAVKTDGRPSPGS